MNAALQESLYGFTPMGVNEYSQFQAEVMRLRLRVSKLEADLKTVITVLQSNNAQPKG